MPVIGNVTFDPTPPPPRTLPDHESCVRHRHYKLSCQQYEGLLARSGQRCEICRKRGGRSAWGKLHIDHCGQLWAVRGLLCSGCNTQLRDDVCTRPGAAEYLANSWWESVCVTLGFPAGRRPEPPVGSAIRNQYGTVWIHQDSGMWYAPKQDTGPSSSTRFWDGLHDAYGPHNLVPYDLSAAYADGSMHHGVKYCLENAHGWILVRKSLGLPEPGPRKPRIREWQPRDGLPWLATPEKTAAALRSLLTPGECSRIAELFSQEESDTGQPVTAASTKD